jgi:hypothetical protein
MMNITNTKTGETLPLDTWNTNAQFVRVPIIEAQAYFVDETTTWEIDENGYVVSHIPTEIIYMLFRKTPDGWLRIQ